MSGLTAWLMGIVSIVLVGTVLDLVLEGARISKYIRSVFAAVIVLVIVMPIPGILKNGINLDAPFMTDYELQLDENYLEFAEQIKLKSLATGIQAQLASDGVTNAEVQVEGTARGSALTVALVRINLQNAVIDDKHAHIHKYELTKNLVSGYLDIDKGQVIVSG